MIDPIEPYGRADLDTAVEHLSAMEATLDGLQEPLNAVGEVIAAVQATDDIRDPMRDVLVYPNVEDACVAAHTLSDVLEAFEAVSAQLTAALSQLGSDLNASAKEFDDNEADVREEYERDTAQQCEQIEGKGIATPNIRVANPTLALPEGYTQWQDVPTAKLPLDNHTDRLDGLFAWAARVDKEPYRRYECEQCGRHYCAREWVGPCSTCYEEGRSK